MEYLIVTSAENPDLDGVPMLDNYFKKRKSSS